MTQPQPIRRIVTGHDESGRAQVLIDAPAGGIKSPRPGQFSTLLWCTDGAPADMPIGRDVEDMGARPLGTYPPERGTRFMIAEYPAGNVPRRHRTETIDYIIVLSGRIEMELDDGERVAMGPGDVMVQRGTYHAWRNPGPDVCRMVFVLVDATPLGIGEPLRRGDGSAHDQSPPADGAVRPAADGT
ncbi:MAG: cupin 2 protein [Blastococcus sp.]|jgi:quercetin dioxygenase-like cupin family protein|nr:cupin 2 protein [Blastococcus sp.]